ncbi:MAG: retropepsin-like aspartic protease, partial [Aeromonas sp.]
MAGCTVHQTLPLGAPTRTVHVGKRPYRALLDSGSTITLVQPAVVRQIPESKATVPITCVHGDTRNVPARRVTITGEPETWQVEVGIVQELPVPVVLGRDWPGFEKLLAATVKDKQGIRGHRKRRTPRTRDQRQSFLATGSEREGEYHDPSP